MGGRQDNQNKTHVVKPSDECKKLSHINKTAHVIKMFVFSPESVKCKLPKKISKTTCQANQAISSSGR